MYNKLLKNTAMMRKMISKLKWKYYGSRNTISAMSPPAIKSRVLIDFLRYLDIQILDVGAKNGPVEELSMFAPFSTIYLCEPSKTELEKINKMLDTLKKEWRDIKIIPEALYDKEGTFPLHVYMRPGLTSLLKINKEEVKKYSMLHRRNSDKLNNVSRITTISLDRAAQKYGMQNISVVKLDTQGSEIDILRSGTKTFQSFIAIFIEIYNIPLYENQPSFNDAHAFLSKHHFQLFDLKRHTLRRRTKSKVAYSKREFAWTDSLYFRKCNEDGSPLSPIQTTRLAGIAFAFEYFDYAVYLLEQPHIQKYLRSINFEGIETEIIKYSNEFWTVLKKKLNKEKETDILLDEFHDSFLER